MENNIEKSPKVSTPVTAPLTHTHLPPQIAEEYSKDEKTRDDKFKLPDVDTKKINKILVLISIILAIIIFSLLIISFMLNSSKASNDSSGVAPSPVLKATQTT